MVEKRPALGRGLSALIPDAPAAPERTFDVDIDLIRPNKFQPRTTMNDDRLEDLARSIRANGVIQPIVVRRSGDGYEIIAGERRWRASQRAGLLKIPVVVREIPEDRVLAVALIENVQREDLNPIEEAHAYHQLAEEFHLTQEQIAESVGKDRSSIANYVRLLKLPHEVRESVASGGLSMGHARANRRKTSIRGPPKSSFASRWAHACGSSGRERPAGSRSISPRKTSSSASTSSSPNATSRAAFRYYFHSRKETESCDV